MSHGALLSATALGSGIADLDWGIVAGFLGLVTVCALVAKGRQAGVRDFFLGNRNLPWMAVCISLMATEISAASFAGAPYIAYKGSLSYLQLAIGAILARILIAGYFVPHLLEHETYSPYDFVGRRLGFGAERMTSALFMLGAVLGQGVRVFICAYVLELITGVPIARCIGVIAAFAALWAAIGGIRTVVWTNVVQFIVLMTAALAGVAFIISQTGTGLAETLSRAADAGKLHFLDLRFDQVLELTLWTALFGGTFNTLASHGADQMNTQGIFCCRSVGDARKAVLWSSLSQVVVLGLLFVGMALWGYYRLNAGDLSAHTLDVSEAHVFPIFIATVMPVGLKGLLVVGIMAAAISSLAPALAALAQTTVRAFYVDVRNPIQDEKSQVYRSRLLTLLWGIILGLTALYFEVITPFEDLVGMALKSTSLTYGALLGALLLALLPHRRNGRGLIFAAPLAVLAGLGTALREEWGHWVVIAGVTVLLAGWCYMLLREVESLLTISDHNEYLRRAWFITLAEFPRTIWVLAAGAVVIYLHFSDFYPEMLGSGSEGIAWPWYLPMGVGITVGLGYLLSGPREAGSEPRPA